MRAIFRALLVLMAGALSLYGQAPRPPVDKLSLLTDVNISSPLNLQVLSYDTASGKWKNTTGGGADTNGCKFGFHGGGSGSAATVNLSGIQGSGAAQIITIDSAISSLWTSSESQLFFKGFATTRSTGTATLSFQVEKVTSGTATVRKGSLMRYRQVVQ